MIHLFEPKEADLSCGVVEVGMLVLASAGLEEPAVSTAQEALRVWWENLVCWL